MAKQTVQNDSVPEDANEVAARAAEVTTDSAQSAEDMEKLALHGRAIPSGWLFNPARGFYQANVEIPADAPMIISES